jgi:hypothetical protein
MPQQHLILKTVDPFDDNHCSDPNDQCGHCCQHLRRTSCDSSCALFPSEVIRKDGHADLRLANCRAATFITSSVVPSIAAEAIAKGYINLP